MSAVIACEDLVKSYGPIAAVDGLSLSIAEGEVFGLVGPNGAGKTTLIEMLEGLRAPDSGSIRVLGLDPTSNPEELHEKIGVQLQATSIQPNITVSEALGLFAALYRRPLADPGRLLRTLSLEDKSRSRFGKLSGGQKQRVAIALALVNDPQVVFFDELTTGLDPQARRSMWKFVRELKAGGRTIFLTTHYMEEAEALCDRVAVIDRGRIIALDAPRNLAAGLGAAARVLFEVRGGLASAPAFDRLPAVQRVEVAGNRVTLHTSDSDATLLELVRTADRLDLQIQSIRTEISSLEDAFLALTGKELRE